MEMHSSAPNQWATPQIFDVKLYLGALPTLCSALDLCPVKPMSEIIVVSSSKFSTSTRSILQKSLERRPVLQEALSSMKIGRSARTWLSMWGSGSYPYIGVHWGRPVHPLNHDCSRNSDWHATAAPVPFHGAARCELLSRAQPHPDPPVLAPDVESALVTQVDSASIAIAKIPIASLCGPSQSCL